MFIGDIMTEIEKKIKELRKTLNNINTLSRNSFYLGNLSGFFIAEIRIGGKLFRKNIFQKKIARIKITKCIIVVCFCYGTSNCVIA